MEKCEAGEGKKEGVVGALSLVFTSPDDMDLPTIFLIVIGVAMDDFAAAIALEINVKHDKWRFALVLASVFAVFQIAFPLVGQLAGQGLREIIAGISSWIAFGLLALSEADMIYDSVKNESSKQMEVSLISLLVIAAATTIEELIVGVTFAFVAVSIFVALIVMATTDFFASFVGSLFGSKIGTVFGNRVKAIGGVILIIIGREILVEHLI